MSQILVKGGNIWDGTKNPLQHNLDLLITDTKITDIGQNLEVNENIQVINAVGKTNIEQTRFLDSIMKNNKQKFRILQDSSP